MVGFTLLVPICLFAQEAALSTPNQPAVASDLQIVVPSVVLAGIPFALEVVAVDADGAPAVAHSGTAIFEGLDAGAERVAPFQNGRLTLEQVMVSSTGPHRVAVRDGALQTETTVRAIPGFFSILPPVLAITLALVFRQVIISLFAGIWLAAIFIFDYNIVTGFYQVLSHFIINAVTTKSQAQIVVFSLLFGGMVGVISRNGGARGIAELITRYARSAKGGQVSTMAMAIVIFFDDYANVLIRGNLMRPITDKLRISREKLAFLVDTGAASVASTVLISTWIGYEVGLIDQGLQIIGSDEDGYSMFVRTIPYRFYPLLALVFAFLVGFTDRDFGPMLRAERRARLEGKVLRDGAEPATETLDDAVGDTPANAWNGMIPILSIIAVGLYGIYQTGVAALRATGQTEFTLGEIVSNADSYEGLLWASLSGCAVAIAMAVGSRSLNLGQAIGAWIAGLKSMMMAIVILVLAWSIGAATTELQASAYLVQLLEGSLNPVWLPVLTFVIAAAMAFATGTSWATMAIMMPLVIPLASVLGTSAGLAPERVDTILVGVISSVLAGSVFGDHCSPISDTTILSSMASASDHIDHVRTQLPYAVLVAVVGMIAGDIPTAYGLSPWISLAIGTAALVAALFILGKPVGDPPAVGAATTEA